MLQITGLLWSERVPSAISGQTNVGTRKV